MGIRIYGSYRGVMAPKVRGMIDGNVYHCNTAAWPAPLMYVQINAPRESEPVHFTDSKEAMDKLRAIDGANIRCYSTADIGDYLVRLNSRTYNEEIATRHGFIEDYRELSRVREEIKNLLNGRKREEIKNKDERRRLDDLEGKEKLLKERTVDVYRKDIPSLIIAPTMDMELAHIRGYDGEFIYQQDKETGNVFFRKEYEVEYLSDDYALMFQSWERQISDMEVAAASNPLRLFPLFSYDPRRYRLPNRESPWNQDCETWKAPFARIVGHGDSADGIKKIWLGFCMNPAFGYRPFDEYCEHLPRFYKECEDNNVPILAYCAPGGITTHEAAYYPKNSDERIEKSEERHEIILKEKLSTCQNNALGSDMYPGTESVVSNADFNRFYMNYGHPRNWIPVLEYFPKLRLCLSGFGGNSEWRLADWSDNDTLPSREWIRVIIKLTAKYEKVYADISGLNIYDKEIRNGFLKMLDLMQDEENDGLAHLKHKLIFGSGWYLTYLTEVSDGGKSVDGRDDVRHSYSNYCREFKKFFYKADKERKGKLWEHVSLINPWEFYGLSEDKINKIHDEL